MTDEKTSPQAQNNNKQGPQSKSDEQNQNPLKFYKNLIKQAQEVAHSDDWQKAEQQLDDLSHRWSDGPEASDEEQEEKIKDLFYKFTKATESFEDKKEQQIEESERQREQNLDRKKQLLNKLKKIVNKEQWKKRDQVNSIEGKWHNTGPVPNAQKSDLRETFNRLIKEFRSHKVDQIVERRQKREENLVVKMTVLDKMEKVVAGISQQTSDWKKVDNNFDQLTKQWKKIGRVPRDKADHAWDRYKKAQDDFYDAKYKFDKKHRSKVDKFTAKKEKLCRQAEGLLEQDLLKASKKINGLHRRWKKAGNLPQRKEDELWDRFKTAIDAFNEKKANHKKELKEREQANYEEKEQLIADANDIKNTEEWKKGHSQMQDLMDQWKKSGPVSQRHSNQLWKKFKGAMDHFYDRRREHFKASKEEQKENLKEKEEILEKLHELGQHEDPIAAVEEAKKLQKKFKDIGYVPIEKKNETWKRYREACDVIYDRMRAVQSGDKFDKELAKADLDHEQREKIQKLRKKHKKIEKEAEEIKDELLQSQESMSYFTSSDDDNPLLQEMQQKIDAAKQKLDKKEDELMEIDKEMDMIQSN